jgi:hypothetical protein
MHGVQDVHEPTCAVVAVESVAGDMLSNGRFRLGVHVTMAAAAAGATRAAGTGAGLPAVAGIGASCAALGTVSTLVALRKVGSHLQNNNSRTSSKIQALREVAGLEHS